MMNKKVLYPILFITIGVFMTENTFAQHRMIQRKIERKIEQDMVEKYAEPQREKGRQSIKEATYEDKSAIIDKKYRSVGTIVYNQKTYKKNGKLDQEVISMYQLSLDGELITITMDKKQSSKLLFIYDQNAHYMIDDQNKTAIKMPLRHINRMLLKRIENKIEESNSTWKKTGQTEMVNGYKCEIYEQIDENGNKGKFWIAQNVTKSPLYINSIQFISYDMNQLDRSETIPNNASLIKAEFYEKDGHKSMDLEMKEYSPKVDSSVFDLSSYKVQDIVDGF